MKTFVYFGSFAVLFSVLVSGVRGAEHQREDPLKAIEQANAQFSAAYAKGDPKAVAKMYTETGRLLPPNAPVLEGWKAIEEFWRGAMESGVKTIDLKTVEVESFGNTIIEQGTATLFGKDDVVLDKGKYVVVWKHVDGEWKLHRDCWNSSEPASN